MSEAAIELPREIAVHPFANVLAWAARMVSGVTPHWRGCAPEPAQRIYFANHTSHLDAVVLWACLPPALRARTRPVAALDYWTATAMRRALASRVFRAVLVDRAGAKGADAEHDPLAPLRDALAAGESLILFPEGTRGDGESVQRFRSGLHRLHLERPAVQLVPVHLENLNRILPKGELVPIPLLSRATFGSPLVSIEGETREVFLERARSAVADLAEEEPS